MSYFWLCCYIFCFIFFVLDIWSFYFSLFFTLSVYFSSIVNFFYDLFGLICLSDFSDFYVFRAGQRYIFYTVYFIYIFSLFFGKDSKYKGLYLNYSTPNNCALFLSTSYTLDLPVTPMYYL